MKKQDDHGVSHQGTGPVKHTSVTGIIPARYGSSRLPAKPLIDLCGKPMIRHVYERASKSHCLDSIVVATDHTEIARAVKSFGGNVIMTPPELTSGTDRVAYAAAHGVKGDIIVNIQGDEPLINPTMIDAAAGPLLEDAGMEAGTLIREIQSAGDLINPNIVKVVIDNAGFALYFSRSPIPYCRDNIDPQQWPLHHTFYKHIGLYVYRRDLLLRFASWEESKLEQAEKLEQLRLLEHGVRIKATSTTEDSIPVDTTEDAENVRTILRTQASVSLP